MATNYNLSGGITAIVGYGDLWKFSFLGTWATGDTWTLDGAFQSSPFTLGWGDVSVNGTPTVCFTYKNRVYLGVNQNFNFSDNSNPTQFEQQGPGAGFVQFLSQLGGQDAVAAFGQIQGRLTVLGRRSIQVWETNADPLQFAIAQQLDNTGTQAPKSVQNLGDFDVLYLDDTGIRSLRTMEVTLNSYVDDIGTPIDTLVRASMVGYTVSNACGIVEPQTKNYWLFINNVIYVLSRYRSSEISAWSTYEPRGSDNVVFTPQKFVTYNGQVYCRSAEGGLYRYGGTDNTTYDQYSQVTLQTGWMDDGRPDQFKQATSVGLVVQGQWAISLGMNPYVTPADSVGTFGSATTPNGLTDSTYDMGTIEYSEKGTHFSMKAVSANTSTSTPAIFSAFSLHYNKAEAA